MPLRGAFCCCWRQAPGGVEINRRTACARWNKRPALQVAGLTCSLKSRELTVADEGELLKFSCQSIDAGIAHWSGEQFAITKDFPELLFPAFSKSLMAGQPA